MLRAIDKWLAGYLASIGQRPRRVPAPRHLLFCVADHFEPFRGGVGREAALGAVARWTREYAAMAAAFRDADGRPPRHTFFYPQEEYDAACLDGLADLCRRGYGEVEIHLHHRHDTPDGLRRKLVEFRDRLHQAHGLLGRWREGDHRPWTTDRRPQTADHRPQSRADGQGMAIGNVPVGHGAIEDHAASGSHGPMVPLSHGPSLLPAYGFVHGNWALCNARPDGDWCGVDAELGILAETGCYADFTYPSAPSPTQPRMVNAIYRACDRPGRPRGQDAGVACRVAGDGRESGCGMRDSGFGMRDAGYGMRDAGYGIWDAGCGKDNPQSLLLIQGPLALDWRRRKWGGLPALENGEISAVNPPVPNRVDLWVRCWIHVRGRPDWVFVKAHTHGGVAANADAVRGEGARRMHSHLQSAYADGQRWRLHYVTAREMANLVRAAEDGRSGDPGEHRDYAVLPPPFAV